MFYRDGVFFDRIHVSSSTHQSLFRDQGLESGLFLLAMSSHINSDHDLQRGEQQ